MSKYTPRLIKYSKNHARVGGGVHAQVFTTDNPNTVMMFTDHHSKVRYMRYLGLLVNDWGYYVANGEDWFLRDDRVYVIELVRLERLAVEIDDDGMEYGDDAKLLMDIQNEVASLYSGVARYRKNINLSLCPTYAPAIEFTLTDKKLRYKYVGLDDHRGNFMRCPITGHIFPTDALLFD